MKKPTQTLLVCLSVTLASFGFSHLAQAQILQGVDTFTEAAISGDSDVDTDGITALAFDFNGTTLGNQTVNGVTFSGAYLSTDHEESAAQNGYTLTDNYTRIDGGASFEPSGGTFPTSDSAYLGILQSAADTTTTPVGTAVITLNGLTIGDTYEAQFFAFNAGGFGKAYETTETLTGINDPLGDQATLTIKGATTSTEGSYAIATFVATTTTQTFDLSESSTTSQKEYQLNAINLRDVGVVPVPEPSVYLMLGLGLAGLVLAHRVRGMKLS